MAKSSRSPSYPGISLPEAIEKTVAFYNENKKYPVDRTRQNPDAYKSLGYTGENGASKRVLAALLSFGLLEQVGLGSDAKVQISERGYNIVVLPNEASERADLLKDALLSPKIYAELVDEFHEGIPVNDSVVKTYLIKRGFNPDSIDSMLSDFRASVNLVGIENVFLFESKSEMPNVRNAPNESEHSSPTAPTIRQEETYRSPVGRESATSESKTLTIPLGGDQEISIIYPKNLKEDDFDFFLLMMKNYRSRLVNPDHALTAVSNEDASTAPQIRVGQAFWLRNNEYEPVLVEGFMGEMAGKVYVRVKGSQSGVPLDELEYDIE